MSAIGNAGRLSLFAVAALVSACTTRIINLDSENPAVTVSLSGVKFGDRLVSPFEVPEILDDHAIPRNRVIHILLEPQVRDLRQARLLMGCLAKAGYTRSVLVTRRHAESFKPPRRNGPAERWRR